MTAQAFLDACGFIPASGGTASFVVSAAITGYQTPASAGAVNGTVYSYRAESADKTQWEEGFGTYTVSSTTLARSTVTANSSGGTSAINFSAAPNVFITALSADLQNASLLKGGQVPVAQLENSLASLMRGYLSGLILSTAGASSSFGVSVGVAVDKAQTDFMQLTSAVTKTTGAFTAGSGNGSLDTGTIAVSTWYHVHEIKNLSTGAVDILTSTSATSPTLPSGFTIFRRIGSLKTDASSHWVSFTQRGDEFTLVTTVTDISNSTQSTTAVTYTMASVPTGIVVKWLGSGDFESTANEAGGRVVALDKADQAATSGSVGAESLLVIAAAGVARLTAKVAAYTNTSAQISVRADVALSSFHLNTGGWIDTRGRFD
jgi:hypothetical protein